MKDDGFADAADRAWSFSASLISSVNLSATLMTILVAKGVMSKDEALWAIDEAAEASAKMNLPEVYAHGITVIFEQVRSKFDPSF